MCGRYTLSTPADLLVELFGLDAVPDLPARFNIAPTQQAALVRVDPADGTRRLASLRWGLVPFWAKDAGIGNRMINARAETVAEKPAFRIPFRKRRCLIPADGYYEWKPVEGRKQPYYFTMKDGHPFCFAGLWDRWQPADGEPVESCAIITTGANDLGAGVHPRMPVIIAADAYARWLDPRLTQAEALLPLLAPFPADAMTAYPVSTLVNNARVDEPRCITPLADPA